uniref:Peroxisomal fatty acid beta-oxidation multifunctional protein AIM1 isoform X1 n=1 Tax=Rhizophora mucronata TaxID=61149 RepID=A0A2P2MFW1_RHIMU
MNLLENIDIKATRKLSTLAGQNNSLNVVSPNRFIELLLQSRKY